MGKRIRYLFIFCFLVNALVAQKATEDILFLKDGSTIKGNLLEYKKEGQIKFQLKNGQILEFAEEELDELKQDKVIRESPLKTKGFYHAFYVSAIPGKSYFEQGLLGFGLEYVNGYWVNEGLGIGLGTGIFNLDPGYSWNVVPIFVDFKAKSPDRSPIYVGGDLGLAYPLRAINSNVRGGRPGERFRIGIGKIWTSKNSRHTSLELSYLHQRSIFESWTWNRFSDDFTDRNMRFKRYQIRVGFLF